MMVLSPRQWRGGPHRDGGVQTTTTKQRLFMSLAQAIAPHLPYLRRFARVLAGSQSGGDAYAVATLEAILADPAALDRQIDLRVALYRVFLTVWQSAQPDKAPAATGTEAQDEGFTRLEQLTPRPRVAFLLAAVEGFPTAHVAQALNCSEDEAAALLAEAGKELSEQLATDILIIEDEPIIAMDLETLVESLGHRVIDVARTHSEALEAVKRHRPGLVLADIQLADGSSGLDAVNDILAEAEMPVIFITAYPERLLTGARPEPTFLVTKPFSPDAVKAVISQALFFERRSHQAGPVAAAS